MGKPFTIGNIAGIRLQVHWSFLLIIAWVGVSRLLTGASPVEAALGVAFVLAIFTCVVLHELGHAMAARLFGIETRDITLLPIGGVARLERIPKAPLQELVIALAGPAVNVVIAALLTVILASRGGLSAITPTSLTNGDFLPQLLAANILLVLFNLIPAFPMDGGRVFRACMATFLDYGRATRIAATTGQICAVGFVILGFSNPFLFLIAAFIFFAGSSEARQVMFSERLGHLQVRHAMLTTFQSVPASAIVDDVEDDLLHSLQRDFPVISEGRLVGMLRRQTLLEAVMEGDRVTVETVMDRSFRSVEESDPLITTLEAASGRDLLPVTSDGQLAGLIDRQHVLDIVHARTGARREPGRNPQRPSTNVLSRPPLTMSPATGNPE